MDNNVDKMRIKKELSKKQLSIRLNTTRQSLDRLINGETQITLHWLERIAKALDCYPSELLPNDWQKLPDINEKLHLEITTHVVNAAKDINLELTPKQLSVLISSLYSDAITNPESVESEKVKLILKGLTLNANY